MIQNIHTISDVKFVSIGEHRNRFSSLPDGLVFTCSLLFCSIIFLLSFIHVSIRK